MDTNTKAIPTKEQILTLLDAWIRQRPGLEFGNYGDAKSYNAELRSITKDLREARQLLRYVELSGITAERLMEGFRAFSGRLSITPHTKPGTWRLDYVTGQYWPTEYRRAVCAVLASAIWDYFRDECMPAAIVRDGQKTYPHAGGGKNEQSAGDWLRDKFRREFGRGIQQRWFN